MLLFWSSRALLIRCQWSFFLWRRWTFLLGGCRTFFWSLGCRFWAAAGLPLFDCFCNYVWRLSAVNEFLNRCCFLRRFFLFNWYRFLWRFFSRWHNHCWDDCLHDLTHFSWADLDRASLDGRHSLRFLGRCPSLRPAAGLLLLHHDIWNFNF